MKKIKNTEYIYIIKEGKEDIYKIGYTKNNPYHRLKELQTGNSKVLHMIFYYSPNSITVRQLEYILHSMFINKRILNEWFYLSLDDIEYIKGLCNRYN